MARESCICERNKLYQLFFLYDDADHSVEIIETREIDVNALIQDLQIGESVFITTRRC
jgi:hypothetical protein